MAGTPLLEPEPKRDPEVLRKMTELLDLFDTSLLIMRQNLRRQFPAASSEEIEPSLGRPGDIDFAVEHDGEAEELIGNMAAAAEASF